MAMKINQLFLSQLRHCNFFNIRCLLLCLWFVTVLILAGCRRPVALKVSLVGAEKLSSQEMNDELVLAPTDISLPLGLVKYHVGAVKDPSQYVVDYYSSFTPLAMHDFFELDMERLGWRLLTKFSTNEQLLLLFDKPQTWCIISVAACSTIATAISKTTIFVGPKAV